MQILTNYNFKLNLFGPKYDKPKALERFEVKIKRGRKNGKHQKALEREALLNEELVKSINNFLPNVLKSYVYFITHKNNFIKYTDEC